MEGAKEGMTIWVLVQIVRDELNETAITSNVRAYGGTKNALSD